MVSGYLQVCLIKPGGKGVFAKLLLAVIGAREVGNSPHIFLTRDTKKIRKLIDILMEP